MPMPPAIAGGTPVRATLLPYSRQTVTEEDIAAVTAVLRSDWLTTGPAVGEFERAFAAFAGTKEAVAVNSGTAALHAAMFALGIGPGDEVIVPGVTFAATANAAVFQGGVPVFADVEPGTLLIEPAKVEAAITPRTKAIVAVDYAGQPCDEVALRAVAARHGGIHVVADACHALGGSDARGKPVGSLADLSTFSFHAVKPLATGEGGMITTDDPAQAKAMRQFRNHGITTDHRERHAAGSWAYEMVALGYNYRLTDIQCALGLSQLAKVPAWTKRRQAIAERYDAAFAKVPGIRPLSRRPEVSHAYHLYVVLVQPEELTVGRGEIFRALRAENLAVNVHYPPPHLHPYYRERFGMKSGMCPVAEDAAERMISLPLFAGMSDQDAADVIEAVEKVCAYYGKVK